MARGSISKDKVRDIILVTFNGAFVGSDGKTLRIPMQEEGETIEIKVSLVAAKDLEGDGNPSSVETSNKTDNEVIKSSITVAPTKEELDKVQSLLEKLSF